jgi:hypothetical protein
MTEDECVVRGKWPREGSMGASGDDRFLTLPGVQRICDGCLRSFWYRIVEQAAFTEELVGLENRDHGFLALLGHESEPDWWCRGRGPGRAPCSSPPEYLSPVAFEKEAALA